MTFRDTPDVSIPSDNDRCEAATKRKPNNYWPQWAREPHRCPRRAVQGRDGKGVCAIHARVENIEYWTGGADSFPWNINHQRKLLRRK